MDRALVAAVAEMYVLGISTRKVEEVAGALGVSSMSKSQVSRLCESLGSEVAAFRRQRFDGVRFAYLWLDAAPPNPERAVEKLLLAGHDVRERAQRLGVCAAASTWTWMPQLSLAKAPSRRRARTISCSVSMSP